MDDDDDNNNNNNNILVTIGNKHSKHTFPRKASFFVTFPYTTVPIFELLYRYVFSPVLSCRAVVWNNRLMLASSMEIHLSSSSHLTVGPSVTYSVVNASLNNQMPMFTLDVCLQQPRGLRLGSAVTRLLGLRVRIPPGAWMFVYCVLYGRRADHSSGGVLPTVVCLCVIVKHR